MQLKDFVPFDDWIPKEEMETGKEYLCKARNFEIGEWNGEAFEYTREKFGMKFPDTEFHWDDGLPHGTVKPLKKIEDMQ